MFYSRYLKEEAVGSRPTAHNGLSRSNYASSSPRSSSQSTQPSSRNKANLSTGRWGGLGKTKSQKPPNFAPLKYSKGKKTVHFSTIEVQHFHFDWNCVDDCFYSRQELTAMGSARFDDAALLRKERHLDTAGNEDSSSSSSLPVNSHSHDDLECHLGLKTKPKSITTLLETALDDPDSNPTTSIRGIEHFVYPELQQEMIRKKKEVQAQVMLYVRSKRPDPQGWRLANHSRMYSQWARDVALEKGRAYRMQVRAEGENGHRAEGERDGVLSPSNSIGSIRNLTSSASFSAASYVESIVSPSNSSIASPSNTALSSLSPGKSKSSLKMSRRSSDNDSTHSTSKGLLKNAHDYHYSTTYSQNNVMVSMVDEFDELKTSTNEGDLRDNHAHNIELRKTMSDEYNPRQRQGAGDNTEEA